MKLYDPRAIESLSFQQLEQRQLCYAQFLLRLRAWRVFSLNTVYAIWLRLPEAVRCRFGLERLERAELIEWSPDRQVLQLGRRGSRLFQQHGIATRYRPLPAPRVLSGMLLVSEMALAIETSISTIPELHLIAGRTQAFHGRIARPDGMLALITSAASRPSVLPAFELWTPQPSIAAGERVLHVALEIDDGSERPRQLNARFANWSRALVQSELAGLPNSRQLIVIHLTTGGRRRCQTIRAAWRNHTEQPALFSSRASIPSSATTGLLDVAAGRWTTTQGETLSGAEVFKASGYISNLLREEDK